MKKIVLFLIFSMLFQGFSVSTAVARGLYTVSRVEEEQLTLQLPVPDRIPIPNLPNYRVYNTNNKIIVSSRVPIAGLQFETNGNWTLNNDLVSDGWNVREHDGTVLVYNLSDKVLTGYVELFNYSGSLEIDEVIAADRQGRLIKKWPNSKTVFYEEVSISEEKVKEYSDFFDKVAKTEDVKLFAAAAATSTSLFAGNASGVPGQNDILFHISMNNTSSDVVGVQFNLNDLPDWITASSAVSQISGFDSYVNDYNGAAEVMVISLSGETMPVGTNIPLVDLYLNMDSGAVLGDVINMDFSNIIISDSLGVPLVGEGFGGTISAGVKGDINSDGEIDILDVVKAINFSIHLETPTANELWAADMNEDGYVNILDTVQIINLVFIVLPDALTVSLYQSPPSVSMPEGSPNDFLRLELAAGGEDITIESLTLTSYGLGTSVEIDNVTLYQDGIKVGTSGNVNADREVVFNFANPLYIPANSSAILNVKATISTASSSGETYALGIESADDIITGGVVNGSYPLQGNLMTSVTASIGTASLSSVIDNSMTVSFGQNDVLLASFNVNAGSSEDLLWETARLINGGTNNSDIVSNLRIEVDGNIIQDGASMNGRYIDFDMGNLLVPNGTTSVVEVYGDIGVASVGNTVDFYIDNISDLLFRGDTYGFGVQPFSISNLDTPGEGITVTLMAGQLIMGMDNAATPSKDIRGGIDDVVLATVHFTLDSEDATINDISNTFGTDGDFYIAGIGLSSGEATNFELRDVDSGIIYNITETASTTIGFSGESGWTLAMNDEISLTAGVTKTFELRVDLSGPSDAQPIDDGDTLKVYLEDGAMNVTGDESNATISDIAPSAIVSATTTIRDASLNITTNVLADTAVVGGASGPVIIYQAGLEVGDTSDLNLFSYRVDVDNTYYSAFRNENISQLDLYIVEDSVERLLKSTSNQITNGGLATGYINFTSLDIANRVLTAGTDVDIVVKATFASSTPITGQFALEAVSTSSHIVVRDEVNADVTEIIANALANSRLVTVASAGTLKAELKTVDAMSDEDVYILAGSETLHGRYLAELVFTTVNEGIELTDIALEEYGNSTGADISVVKLYDENGTVVAYKSPTAAGHVHFESADFLNDENVLLADESTSFFVGVLAKSMNADGDPEGTASFNRSIRYSFATSSALAAFGDLGVDESVKARGVDSGEDITIVENTGGLVAFGEYELASVKSKTASTTGSILNVITNDMDNGTLAGGNNKVIGQYRFFFDNGSNRTSSNEELKAQLRQLVLTLATSTGVVATNIQAYIEGDAGNQTAAVNPTNTEASINLAELDPGTSLVDGEVVLVIVADLFVTGSDQYLQTEIADLTTDFTYNGNHDEGIVYWSNARLDGISQVTGGTLSN